MKNIDCIHIHLGIDRIPNALTMSRAGIFQILNESDAHQHFLKAGENVEYTYYDKYQLCCA